ncbi:MAG: methyl-accepting chemotaxis protein [Methylococcaceae bacterium]|nr:methyl-accepting chemotaxis protein [Methylococcaceae bacterium]
MDLTRLARTYVATGEQRYWNKYFDIVNWRNGKTPRPDSVNRELYPNQNKAQLEIMRELKFSDKEFELLSQASAASNDLIKTETQAMESIRQGMFVKGPFVPLLDESLKHFSLRILFDDNYHKEVVKIMSPVGRFFDELDRRTSNFLDEASNASDFWLHFSVFLQILTIIITTIIIWLIIGMIFRPLSEIITGLKSLNLDNGRLNLAKRLDNYSGPEMNQLVNSFNSLLEKFQASINQVVDTTSQLATTAEETSVITEKTTQAVDQQLAETNQLETAMSEMSTTIQDVASHTLSTATAATEVNNLTTIGLQAMTETIGQIQQLAGEVESASSVIQQLEQHSDEIGSVLDVIKGIAEQTNLLALNAAIEAARAGEQGRGFAVVADEVRNLASKTQASTEEINQMIEKLQSGSRQAVAAMNHSKDKAYSASEQASKTGEALSTITEAISRINDMSIQVSSTAEEQSVVVGEISKNVSQINTMTEQTAIGAKQTSIASVDLSRLAMGLQDLVARFQVR